MKIKFQNSSQPAKVFYGLHFQPGTAEYVNEEGQSYKILINQGAINAMNPTYPGRPVYVDHVDQVDWTKVEREAAGFVVESFYNKSDGNTWVKFVVFSDEGLACIQKGWSLSNSYKPMTMGPGGSWHGMKYEREVLTAKFDHLAIVPNPRYEASIILDVDQFKAYNEEQEKILLKVANSKDKVLNKKQGAKTMKFNFFKKETVDNSAELEGMQVTIGGKDMSVKNALEIAEKFQNMHGYASDEHMVKTNDGEEMSVKELRDCYSSMKKKNDEDADDMANKKKNELSEEDKKKNAEEEEKKKNEEDEKKKNAEEEEKKKNESKQSEEEKLKNSRHYDTLFNAIQKQKIEDSRKIIFNSDRVDMGKEMFGSGK